MNERGANAAPYRTLQLEFAAHIRHPELNPAPAEIDPRRMRVYVELFFNNIDRLLSGTFPVAKSMQRPEVWGALVRAFMHEYRCTTPYFPQVAQEFLSFLAEGERVRSTAPAYLLELCHYEWIELALDVDEAEVDSPEVDAAGDVFEGIPVWSPLARNLSYRFPVHLLGPHAMPSIDAPTEPTYLIVYRDRADSVRFMGSNAVTARLAALVQANRTLNGRQLVAEVADALPELQPQRVIAGGIDTLRRLQLADIIAGALRT